ncbi:MAG: class I SAM-dependent methyltransferase [Thermodesulfobacteriota bacterium]
MIKDINNELTNHIFSVLNSDIKYFLDIGCGDGDLTAKISEKCRFTAGIEPDFKKISHTNKKSSDKLFFLVNTGTELSFNDSSFDMVLFCQSLHHIPSDMQNYALKEADRVLKKNGIMLIIEPLYNTGLYGELVALLNNEKELKANALKETKKLEKQSYTPVFEKQLKIDFLINGFDDFYNSKVENKPGINWNKNIESDAKKIIAKGEKKNNGKIIIDYFINSFCFKKN